MGKTLIVDDEEDMRLLLRLRLTGVETARVLLAEEPDLPIVL